MLGRGVVLRRGLGDGVPARTMSTEQWACVRTLRATLPITSRSRPVRPCVPSAMRSAPFASASSMRAWAGSPLRTPQVASRPVRGQPLGGVAGDLLVVAAGLGGGDLNASTERPIAAWRDGVRARLMGSHDADDLDRLVDERRHARQQVLRGTRQDSSRHGRAGSGSTPGARATSTGHGRMVDDLRRDRAEQHRAQRAVTTAAHHDQVRARFRRLVHDRRRTGGPAAPGAPAWRRSRPARWSRQPGPPPARRAATASRSARP